MPVTRNFIEYAVTTFFGNKSLTTITVCAITQRSHLKQYKRIPTADFAPSIAKLKNFQSTAD